MTGIHFLRELLDPELFPLHNGRWLLAQRLPDIQQLIVSGDAGNGFRAYATLEELSTVFVKYGYTIVLSPLAPCYAWNRADGRIAHMKTFL